jgi:hypothetical protein
MCAQIADRVTPALIDLVGLHDDIGECRAGGAVRHRDDRRAGTGRARGVESRIRGGRAALVRDADDQARRRWVE